MKIAVASGKGGTGKTTVSLALAMTALSNVELLDCDVEEPNGHIFLKLENVIKENVSVPVPEINTDSCISCGKCSEICQFNAIVFFGSPPMIFKELCHNCGGCAKICPVSAIREIPNVVGHITKGIAGSIEFIQGQLNIGLPMASPVIRQVIRLSGKREDTVIDSPPGTSCSMISAVKESDFVILVAEPTPFGLNDLQIAVETIEKLFIPMGVIINRSDSGDDRVEKYCKEKGLELLMKIPFSIDIAKAYSNGMPLIISVPELAEKFKEIWTKVRLHKRESK